MTDDITHAVATDITLEMAAQDSPFFRDNVDTFETELDELVKWLDGMVKALKLLVEELGSKNYFLWASHRPH